MIDLIFWLELHYKKATLQKTALFPKTCKKDAYNIFLTYLDIIYEPFDIMNIEEIKSGLFMV